MSNEKCKNARREFRYILSTHYVSEFGNKILKTIRFVKIKIAKTVYSCDRGSWSLKQKCSP